MAVFSSSGTTTKIGELDSIIHDHDVGKTFLTSPNTTNRPGGTTWTAGSHATKNTTNPFQNTRGGGFPRGGGFSRGISVFQLGAEFSLHFFTVGVEYSLPRLDPQ